MPGTGAINQRSSNVFSFTAMMQQVNGDRTPKLTKQTAGKAISAALGPDQTKGLQTYSRVYLAIEEQKRQTQKRSASNSALGGKKESGYNHSQYCRQLKQAKSPQNIRAIAADIRSKINELYTKLYSEEYDYEDIASAIAHAEAMEQAALKRADHLEKEQMAERKLKKQEEEERIKGEDEQKGVMIPADEDILLSDAEKETKKAIEEEMKALMQEMQRQMAEEMAEETEEVQEEAEDADPLDALDDMAKVLRGDVSEEDIETMKKKHRAAEDMEMTRADMEYLKAKFDRLQRQKDAIKNGAVTGAIASAQTAGNTFSVAVSAVSTGSGHAHTTYHADASVSAASPAPSVGVSVDVEG